MKQWMRLLLLFAPVALAAELLHWSPMFIFATSALAIIPLAALLGDATEALALFSNDLSW